MKQIRLMIKHGKGPIGMAAGVVLAVKVLGFRRVLLLGLGAAAGFYFGTQKAKEDWNIIT